MHPWPPTLATKTVLKTKTPLKTPRDREGRTRTYKYGDAKGCFLDFFRTKIPRLESLLLLKV